jgi:Protein of unknown function (DUF3800)
LKILFLDESGDHNLSKIDDQYPVFVLGGIIVDMDSIENIDKEVDLFKLDMFGTTDTILHTADITRNKNGFEALKDSGFRSIFFDRLNSLIENIDFKIIACAIKKREHTAKYDFSAIDPYMLALNVLVEQFWIDIKSKNEKGLIVAEKRSRPLDQELELAWLELKIRGTRHLRGAQIDERITNLSLKDKKENINYLQLADLVVSPIGRYVIGKQMKKDFEIIKSKFVKNIDEVFEGHGLIVLPKSN